MPDVNHQPDPRPGHPSPTEDRRAAVRYPCNLEPTWRVLGGLSGECRLGSVHNLSATGVGLVLQSRVKPGTVLLLKFQHSDQRLSRPLPVRVMHATALPDGGWLTGCAFVRRLSNEELAAFVQGAPPFES
jgi:hypothetical protein